MRLLTPLPRDPRDPRDSGDPRDPRMSSGRAPMTVKTQYTGPFFPENESIYPWNLRNPRNLGNPRNPRNPGNPRNLENLKNPRNPLGHSGNH